MIKLCCQSWLKCWHRQWKSGFPRDFRSVRPFKRVENKPPSSPHANIYRAMIESILFLSATALYNSSTGKEWLSPGGEDNTEDCEPLFTRSWLGLRCPSPEKAQTHGNRSHSPRQHTVCTAFISRAYSNIKMSTNRLRDIFFPRVVSL